VLSAYDRDARESQRMISAQAVRYLALLALAAIIAVSITAPTLLHALFGPAYVAGTPALRILAWLALLAASGSVFTNLLIARRLERLLLVLNASSSVLTLGLSMLLVPRAGFVGAAAATLIASVASQAILLLVPEMRREVAACLRPLLWPVLLAAILTLGGTVVPGSRPVGAAAALVVFAIGIVATRTVGPDDWVVLRRVVQRT
jgi:O-antigen/teichoic acid export membrane protein